MVVDVEAGLPRALGFAGELNQIWLNLIDNALDAVPDGGRVEVLANREPQRVVVRVVDNGAGIPEQIRARIFDPFFTTKPVGSGTGLGLDIVRRLVRHNDGAIAVESQAGPDGIQRDSAAGAGRRRARADMNKPVLLIVDDDPQVLAAVRRDLRSHYRDNYTVMSAASGEQALSTARELKSRGDSLALLLSDQRMPGMLGSEVLAKSREVYPLARRVLLTAYSDIEAAVRAINEAHRRSLFIEAVGSARGMPLPGDRRSAGRLAGRVSTRSEGIAAGRPSVVAAVARDQGFPGEQSHSLSLARGHAGPGRARAIGRGRGRRRRASGAFLRRRLRCCATRSRRRSPDASAGRSRPPSMCTTW